MKVRVTYPDGTTAVRRIAAAVVRLGRDADCELAFDAARFPKVSGVHAELAAGPGGVVLTPRSKSNQTLVNDQPATAPMPLRPGDRVRLGYTGPLVELLADDPPRPEPVGTSVTLQADAAQLGLVRGTAAVKRLDVGAGGVVGRDPGVAFVLTHPLVSRKHARLAIRDGAVTLLDLGSANGTFVNGERLRGKVELERGDHVEIGPFALTFDGAALVGRSRANNAELSARGLTRTVTDTATGRPVTLVDDVDLVVRPREFVALIGPSGSGKSTLLGLLGGRVLPDAGAARLNGRDLHANFSALKRDVAVVPQREALHTGLTVRQALRYTAELRLPPDTSAAELTAAVADLLAAVGLTDRADVPIRALSGGQLKRVSLANELVGRPSLLLLDEVTSGLDEQGDREVMEVFRRVAEAGKTVVCVTHNLAHVEAYCHLVVVLAGGGRVAFVGPPAAARAYFEVERLGDVYRALTERPPAAWKAAFAGHELHARFVADRQPTHEPRPVERPAPVAGREAAAALRQAWVLTRRTAAVWRAAPAALAAMAGQALLVAALLALVFGDVSREANPATATTLAFLLNVSCFWLGCNTAARELVKEREIFGRERAFNLRAGAYLASKAAVLIALAAAQATLVFAPVELCCDPPGGAAARWAGLVLLAAAGTGLGLLVSALAATEDVAQALVPVVVIPQLVLAGVVAPLSGVAKALAAGVVTCYWGQRGLDALPPGAELAPAAQFAVVAAHAAAFYALAAARLALGPRVTRRPRA